MASMAKPEESPDISRVRVRLLGFQRVSMGRVIALAHAEIEIDEVPIQILGMRIEKGASGRLACRAPCYRGPDGRWIPAVVLPPEVGKTICELAVGELKGNPGS